MTIAIRSFVVSARCVYILVILTFPGESNQINNDENYYRNKIVYAAMDDFKTEPWTNQYDVQYINVSITSYRILPCFDVNCLSDNINCHTNIKLVKCSRLVRWNPSPCGLRKRARSYGLHKITRNYYSLADASLQLITRFGFLVEAKVCIYNIQLIVRIRLFVGAFSYSN